MYILVNLRFTFRLQLWGMQTINNKDLVCSPILRCLAAVGAEPNGSHWRHLRKRRHSSPSPPQKKQHTKQPNLVSLETCQWVSLRLWQLFCRCKHEGLHVKPCSLIMEDRIRWRRLPLAPPLSHPGSTSHQSCIASSKCFILTLHQHGCIIMCAKVSPYHALWHVCNTSVGGTLVPPALKGSRLSPNLWKLCHLFPAKATSVTTA